MSAGQLVQVLGRLVRWPRAPEPVPRPRTGRRSARRVLAWGVAAVLGANFGFSVALETALPRVRNPEHGLRLTALRELRRKHPTRPLVLVLGSSRAQNAVSPAGMNLPDGPGDPLVFNYAQTGVLVEQLPVVDQRLRGAGVRADAVLVEIFPATLIFEEGATTTFGERGAALTVGEMVRLDLFARDPVARERWVRARLNPWYTFRDRFRHDLLYPVTSPHERFVYRVGTEHDRYGFSPYAAMPFSMARLPDELRRRQSEHARTVYTPMVANLRVSALAVRVHRELVNTARERGVPIAFFVTPESTAFQSWYTPESRAALAAHYRTLSELGAPVFEAPTDLSEEDFSDGHHLLPDGAAKYSRWFAETRLRPWFAEVLK